MNSTASIESVHVLFTGLAYSGVITGGDQLFLDIAPRLSKDLKIIVVTPHFAKKYWDNIDQSNIEFRLLPPNKFELKANPILIFTSYLIRARQVYKILKKEKIQTIYSCSDVAYADIWPAFFIARKQPKLQWLTRVYHVLLRPKKRQGNYIVNAVAFALQRLSFWMMKRGSTTIFALNDKLHDELISLDFPNSKLDTLGAGIDYETISDFKPLKKYPFDVVVLGRIAPVKGIFDAVDIWEIVHAQMPKLRLAWIGGGGDNYRKKMETLLNERGLSDSFSLLGFIEKDDAYSVLKSAKVFLCPDHENGWGLAVCEAMACGLPVVSYDLDIFGGVYHKGYRSTPLFDTGAFASELISLLSNEHLRKRVAKDAAAQAKEYDHKKVIEKLMPYLVQRP